MVQNRKPKNKSVDPQLRHPCLSCQARRPPAFQRQADVVSREGFRHLLIGGFVIKGFLRQCSGLFTALVRFIAVTDLRMPDHTGVWTLTLLSFPLAESLLTVMDVLFC